MATLSGLPDLDDSTFESAEARMRRALGHLEENAAANGRRHAESQRPKIEGRSVERHTGERPRPRFVQDGDVPVTVLSRHRAHDGDAQAQAPTRLSLAESALAAERASRQRAERSLAEALATIHDLQTKWGHAELARQEAVDRAQSERAAAEAERSAHKEREQELTEQLAAERAARSAAENAVRDGRLNVRLRKREERAVEPDPEIEAIEAAPAKRAAKSTTPKQSRARNAVPKQREPKPVKWWLASAKKRS